MLGNDIRLDAQTGESFVRYRADRSDQDSAAESFSKLICSRLLFRHLKKMVHLDGASEHSSVYLAGHSARDGVLQRCGVVGELPSVDRDGSDDGFSFPEPIQELLIASSVLLDGDSLPRNGQLVIECL